MKDKKLFKKWWFWVIAIVIVLGVIGSFGQTSKTPTNINQTDNTQQSSTDKSTLPQLNADDYRNEEGLMVYKDLKNKGYTVDAAFEKQALTDINGKASEVFEPLDPNKPDDRLSVDSFVVGDLTQEGDSVKLSIIQKSN